MRFFYDMGNEQKRRVINLTQEELETCRAMAQMYPDCYVFTTDDSGCKQEGV